jgi:hypothetical protein
MGVSGQSQAPTALPPRKRSSTHCTEDRVAHRAGPDGCGKSNQLEFNHRTVQPIVSHYSDFTIPAHIVSVNGTVNNV